MRALAVMREAAGLPVKDASSVFLGSTLEGYLALFGAAEDYI